MPVKPINETPWIERALLIAFMLLGGFGLFVGWRIFWFLTDDAYIAFRYVSNAHLGYGYVWNASPFLPVEGYTSFLWVALLDLVWRIFGAEPPVSAPWMGLLFSYGSLLLGAAMIMRLPWDRRLVHVRLGFVAVLVVFLLFNRTFLAWSSSGLETAMVDFFLLLWVYVFLYDSSPLRRACLGGLTAACLELSRPDGLLFCAATAVAILLLAFAQSDKSGRRRILMAGFLPFGILVAHQAWRLSFYGALLPNTYYAKVTGIWPESGFRYVLSFVLEYAVWFAAIFIGWAVLKLISGTIQRFAEHRLQADTARHLGVPVVIVGTLILHIGYYTYVVGGDHFEYRVFAHLLPLIFVALVWSLNELRMRAVSAFFLTLSFVLLSMPVQWTHWALTKDLLTRNETYIMRVPVAPHWPKAIRWYGQLFDETQSWLIYHHVCMRHQEHKIFWKTQINSYPSREQGLQIPAEGNPVYATWCVGVPAWVLPHVYVIDEFGLNDYIIARAPVRSDVVRLMAHSRQPIQGYVESYRPNVFVKGGQVSILAREQPLSIDDISSNERYWRDQIKVIEHPVSAGGSTFLR